MFRRDYLELTMKILSAVQTTVYESLDKQKAK